MISLWARRTVRLTVGVCGHDGNTRTPAGKGATRRGVFNYRRGRGRTPRRRQLVEISYFFFALNRNTFLIYHFFSIFSSHTITTVITDDTHVAHCKSYSDDPRYDIIVIIRFMGWMYTPETINLFKWINGRETMR